MVSRLRIAPHRHPGEPLAQRMVRPLRSPVDPGWRRTAAYQAGRAAPKGGAGGAGRGHRRTSLVIGDAPLPLRTKDYSCPVCGIALLASDFETSSGEDYYCPYCSTDQKPSSLPLAPTGRPAQ
jgi:hypothetical protein